MPFSADAAEHRRDNPDAAALHAVAALRHLAAGWKDLQSARFALKFAQHVKSPLPRFRCLLDEAHLARLNARRLIIQAQYLAGKAIELQRAARRACREARRQR